MSIPSVSAPAIPSNQSSQANDEPTTFTHDGHQYEVNREADGGVSVSRDDGITMVFNAKQAAGLQGLPTQNVLFGAPQDIPDASFQGTPLGQLFDNPSSSSAPERLW
jgi:hypothetical protein